MALWFYYSTSMKDVAANIPWVSHFGIWYGLSIQIWKLMMLDTILIPTWSGISIQVQKKTLKLLHLHHFRDFAGLCFSPVWWPPAFFFWFLRRTVLRMQGVIHLADAQSDARFHAGGFSRGNSQANSGVGAKAGLAIRGRGLDAGGVIIYRFHWKRCGCF